jgi:hypothetical protein
VDPKLNLPDPDLHRFYLVNDLRKKWFNTQVIEDPVDPKLVLRDPDPYRFYFVNDWRWKWFNTQVIADPEHFL